MVTKPLSENNDYYTSTLVPNFAAGETGNAIFAHGGDDVVYGNQYKDYIYGEAGNDELHGGGGDDVLVGGAGTNWLYGDAGNDLLQANGSGTNYMFGGAGNDAYVGGSGADHFYFNIGQGTDTVRDIYGADPGLDTLHLNFRLSDAFFDVSGDGNSLIVTTQSDAADGIYSSYVLIESYFSHPEYKLVDQFAFTDGTYALSFG